MQNGWQITQEIKELPKLNNPILIEGLPGIGNVGKVAVDFLIEEFSAKKLYSFFSYNFPHSVFVNEKNLIDMPKLEIYYKKFNSKKKRDLILLTGDIQPIDEVSCYTFCEEVLKIAKKFQCNEFITTGGIGLQSVPEEPKVYCTSNDQKLLKDYLNSKLHLEKEIFGVVGPIVGVSGILLGLGKRHSLKGVGLLAETFGHPMYLGVKGAKELLNVINLRLKLNLNIKKMNKEIFKVETELMQKTKEWLEEMTMHSPAGAKIKKDEVDYIG